MRFLFILVMPLLAGVVQPMWGTDFEQATRLAAGGHKSILLNFSGSDWCGPCIKLHHDFFENESFTAYAGKALVLVNADFPRQKKNQLPAEIKKQNDHLADLYNSRGIFPLTLLLSSDGRVIKSWEGLPKGTVTDFIAEIENAAMVRK